MKPINKLSDIQKLSEFDLLNLKQAVDNAVERRAEPTVEEVELIYYDDGCEGFFFDIHDFQKCARDKNNHDLIYWIEHDLHVAGSVTLSIEKYPKESVGDQNFFGKDNPYEDDFNED